MRDKAKDRERAAAAAVLRKKYAAVGMPGAARLVDFIGSRHGRGLLEFGSSSIGPSGNGRLYIGRPRADPPVSPLEDMTKNYEHMLGFSSAERHTIDQVLGAFAAVNWSTRKLSNRIPFAIRQFVIRMHYRFGWPVSEELGMGAKWWWVPWLGKMRRKRVRFDAPYR